MIWYNRVIHTYGPRDFFGHQALEKKCLNDSRLVAGTDCHLAVLSKKDYHRCLENLIKLQEQQDIDFLQKIPFFTHFSKNQIKRMKQNIKTVECTKTQVMVKENLKVDSIYLVRKGVFSGFTHHKTGG